MTRKVHMAVSEASGPWNGIAQILTGVILTVLTLLLAVPAGAQAVRVSTPGAIPNAALSSLTVSATPGSVHFDLVPRGIASGSSAVVVTTSWGGSLCIFTCTINVYAYFANAGSALSGGSPVVNIPSSAVLGQVPTGIPASFTAFTGSSPFGGAGASLQLFQQSFFLFVGKSSRTDDLNLEINLSGQPQLPAGTYSGTLYIQAQSL